MHGTHESRQEYSLLTSSGSRSELLLLYALLVEDTELQRRIVVVSFLLGPPSLTCFSSYLGYIDQSVYIASLGTDLHKCIDDFQELFLIYFAPDEPPEVPDEVVELLLGDVGIAKLGEMPPHVRLGEQQRHGGGRRPTLGYYRGS